MSAVKIISLGRQGSGIKSENSLLFYSITANCLRGVILNLKRFINLLNTSCFFTQYSLFSNKGT